MSDLPRESGTGRSPLSRRAALLLAAGGLAQLSLPPGRSAATAAPPTGAAGVGQRPAVQALLDARAEALLGLDRAGLLATVAPAARPAQQAAYDRLAQVPFAALDYRLTAFTEPEPEHGSEPGHGWQLTATAELGYRLRDNDDFPAVFTRTLTFVRSGSGWLLSGDEPAGAAALWDLGAVRVARGAHSLLLGLADDSALARTVKLLDRAVPAVSEVWGSGWAGRLVAELPGSEQQFAQLLGVRADDYQGIAAVTTAAAGAPHRTAADRVLINPDAYAILSDLGRRVVTTHETTHVATRADTKPWTPLWLSEGVADYTGYRGTGRSPRQVAPELAKDIQAGRLPRALPADADFAAGSTGIAQAYELGWAACGLIAADWSEQRLVQLYRAVGARPPGADRDQWLDGLFRAQLGLGLDEFLKRWIASLRTSLG
ncbi:hypothetical protein [Kitasatospora sp. MAP5-34]|uniref:hypothetical protein n=1 Tax=Kitasatospora sp. MAP5-34 TaxID=3035102 RepID=UPI00247365DD|nr:hypothetical protein [Kitasatospora sp. MAP5-34]MDH6575104.1 hypothetical protein [Kitasatospora sp. MAP5-34]